MCVRQKTRVVLIAAALCVVASMEATARAQIGGSSTGLQPGSGAGAAPGLPGTSGGYGEDDGSPMAVPRPKPDGTVVVTLKDGSRLVTKLADAEELKINAVYGEVTVPLQKVASIEMSEENAPAVVILRNGDRLSGELVVDKFKFKAQWGEMAIEPKHVLSITGKDLANGYSIARRAIREKGADGKTTVRYEYEVVPVDMYGGEMMPGMMGPGGMMPAGMPGGPGSPYPATAVPGIPAPAPGAAPYYDGRPAPAASGSGPYRAPTR